MQTRVPSHANFAKQLSSSKYLSTPTPRSPHRLVFCAHGFESDLVAALAATLSDFAFNTVKMPAFFISKYSINNVSYFRHMTKCQSSLTKCQFHVEQVSKRQRLANAGMRNAARYQILSNSKHFSNCVTKPRKQGRAGCRPASAPRQT